MPKVTQPKGSIGGFNIYVEEDSLDMPVPRMARHGVLDSNQTVIHYSGKEAFKRNLKVVTLSGYQTRFLPLVGSGYHALYTDKGYQGDYWITGATPERIPPSAPRCYNSGTRRDYRINLNLRKKSGEPAPAWSDQMIFLADNGAVYTTENFSGHDSTAQPTWTYNGAQPTTTIDSADADCEDPWGYIYVQNAWGGSEPGDVWRSTDQGASWTKIFSTAQQYVGETPIPGSRKSFCCDHETPGKIWVMVDGSAANNSYVFYNTNYGTGSWTGVNVYGGNYTHDDIWATGDRSAFWEDKGGTSGARRIRYNESGGYSYSTSSGNGFSSMTIGGRAYMSRNSGYYYFETWDGYTYWRRVDPTAANQSFHFGGVNFHSSRRRDAFWFHPTTSGMGIAIMAGAWNGGAGPATRMGLSYNNFGTTVLYNPVAVGTSAPAYFNVHSAVWRVHDDMPNWMLFGSSGYSTSYSNSSFKNTGHCVLTADFDDGFYYLRGKGGAMAETSPFTDSIPRTCGGPVGGGIIPGRVDWYA